jgi:hypothetical protein
MWDRGLIHRLRFLTWPFRRAWCVLVGHREEQAEWVIRHCRRCRASKS